MAGTEVNEEQLRCRIAQIKTMLAQDTDRHTAHIKAMFSVAGIAAIKAKFAISMALQSKSLEGFQAQLARIVQAGARKADAPPAVKGKGKKKP